MCNSESVIKFNNNNNNSVDQYTGENKKRIKLDRNTYVRIVLLDMVGGWEDGRVGGWEGVRE